MDLEEKKLHIKLAYGYYQNKEYKKAIKLYKQLHKEDPNDAAILNMLGDAYLKSGEKEKALEAYLATINILENNNQLIKMIKLIKKILKIYPNDPRLQNKKKIGIRLLINLAEKKVIQHDYDTAREYYELLIDFDSEEYPIKLKLKELNDEEAKYKERQKKIQEQKVKKEDGENSLIQKFEKMAQNYLQNGDYDGAVESYITALKIAPNNQELRAKLHNLYLMIAQRESGEKVWEKIDKSPTEKLEEAKKKAMEEKQRQILKEEEERARRLMEEEEKIQQELEKKEQEIIQKAAEELRKKLEEAQKREKLQKEEIERIMKEQERRKQELLEKAKREAVEKWKRQKALMEQQNIQTSKSATEKLMENLKKAYEVPKLEKEEEKINVDKVSEISTSTSKNETQEKIQDDIGEKDINKQDEDIEVNEDTLDSLITIAYIYINQGLYKEAMHVYNKLAEKFAEHPEVKQILNEITKNQK